MHRSTRRCCWPRTETNDGTLTVGELYSMRLNADLVTLSACETGLGKIANGDDVVGLTRGFLYAGSRSIVASLWKVDDEATAYLMTRFYGALKARANVKHLSWPTRNPQEVCASLLLGGVPADRRSELTSIERAAGWPCGRAGRLALFSLRYTKNMRTSKFRAHPSAKPRRGRTASHQLMLAPA